MLLSRDLRRQREERIVFQLQDIEERMSMANSSVGELGSVNVCGIAIDNMALKTKQRILNLMW